MSGHSTTNSTRNNVVGNFTVTGFISASNIVTPKLSTKVYSLTLPLVAPAANQILQSDALGNLSWIATPSGGGTFPGFTNGGVVFGGAVAGTIAQDSSKIFWNDTTFSLAIGSNTPLKTLDVLGSGAKIKTSTDNTTAFTVISSSSTTDFQVDTLNHKVIIPILNATSVLSSTITDTTNIVRATRLAVDTTPSHDVVLTGGAPPTTGQVLTALTATTANWQSFSLTNVIGVTPTTPTVPATILSGVSKLEIQDNYAYILGTVKGFQIIDISRPLSANSVFSISNVNMYGMAVQGDNLYISYSDGGSNTYISVYDTSIKKVPGYVSNLLVNTSSTYVQSLFVQGIYLYGFASAANTGILYIWDVSNPKIMVQKSATTLIYAQASPAKTMFVDINHFVYLAGNNNSGTQYLELFNAVDPTYPIEIFTQHIAVLSMTKQDRYLYAVTTTNLLVFDITNPQFMTQIGTYTAHGVGGFVDVIVANKYAFIAAQTDGWIEIVNVSSPATPTYVGNTTANLNTNILGAVNVQGNYIFSANTDPTNAVFLVYDPQGTYIQYLESGSAILGKVSIKQNLDVGLSAHISGSLKADGPIYLNNDTSVDGNLEVTKTTTLIGGLPNTSTYIGTNVGNGDLVANIISANNLYVNNTSVKFPDLSNGSSSTALSSAGVYITSYGKYTYVALNSTNQFQIWDTSDPTNPVSKSLTNTMYTLPIQILVYVRNSQTYLIIATDAPGEIWDVSDPVNPVNINVFSQGAPGGQAGVTFYSEGTGNGLLFSAATSAGIAWSIRDFTNSGDLTNYSHTAFGASALSTFSIYPYVYVFGRVAATIKFDIYKIDEQTDTLTYNFNYVTTSSVATTAIANTVYTFQVVNKTTLYLATSSTSAFTGVFQIFDLSNPAAVTLLTTIASTDRCDSVNIFGNYLYLFSETSALVKNVKVYDVSALPSTPSLVFTSSTFTNTMLSDNRTSGSMIHYISAGANLNSYYLGETFINSLNSSSQLVKSTTNSTSAFVVENSSAGAVLSVDTVGNNVSVNNVISSTITDATNVVRATRLAVDGTTADDIILTGGAPPTTGQVLTATSATTANWQTFNPFTVNTYTTTTTLTSTNYFVNANGTFTITMPDSTTNPGKTIIILNIGTGIITNITAGSDTFDNGVMTTSTLSTQYSRVQYISNGAGLWSTF